MAISTLPGSARPVPLVHARIARSTSRRSGSSGPVQWYGRSRDQCTCCDDVDPTQAEVLKAVEQYVTSHKTPKHMFIVLGDFNAHCAVLLVPPYSVP